MTTQISGKNRNKQIKFVVCCFLPRAYWKYWTFTLFCNHYKIMVIFDNYSLSDFDQYGWYIDLLKPSIPKHGQWTVITGNPIIENNWARAWLNQQNDLTPREKSGQHGYQPSLISLCGAFSGLIKTQGLYVRTVKTSDWPDSQADLSLPWVHMPFCWFCHAAAQLSFSP